MKKEQIIIIMLGVSLLMNIVFAWSELKVYFYQQGIREGTQQAFQSASIEIRNAIKKDGSVTISTSDGSLVLVPKK